MKAGIIVLLAALSIPAFAESYVEKKMVCDDTSTLFTKLKTDYNETATVMMYARDTKIVVFTNAAFSTWSVVEVQADTKTSCIVDLGIGMTLNDKIVEWAALPGKSL
jgi:Tfp pilus assembly major pilin PilA